jgi:hypothetical protein
MPYFIWDVFSISLGYDRILVENIVHQLWSDPDFDLPAFDSFGTRIHQLPRLSFSLTFRRSLR